MYVIVMFRVTPELQSYACARAYYSNSGVTRAVRDCYWGYSCYPDSLLENDRNAHKDHAVRISLTQV